jgi:hypothetical protein
MAASTNYTSAKRHGGFLAVLAGLAFALQPLPATGFSVERSGDLRSRKTTKTTTAISSAKDDRVPPDPSLALEPPASKLSSNRLDFNETENAKEGTTPAWTETNATRTVVSDGVSTTSTSEVDSFNDFASNQTPLIAELLDLKKTGDDSSSLAPPLEITPQLPSGTTDLREADDSSQLTPWTERSSELVVVALAIGALVGILGDLLSNYEWVRTLRYFWPLSLGIYYGLLWNQANDRDASLRDATATEFGPSAAFSPRTSSDDPKRLLLQIGYVFGGFGLFVGGLADALLPVWQTGPNWITNAGLAPDCAVLLLALSVGEEYQLFGSGDSDDDDENAVNNLPAEQTGSGGIESVLVSLSGRSTDADNTVTTMTPLLIRIALWAELYKLGESSLDEILGNLQALLSSST